MDTGYALDDSVTGTTFPNGKTITYELDQYSRKVGQVDTVGLMTAYAFNATNQLARVSNGIDSITYSYSTDTSNNSMIGAPEGLTLASNYTETYQY